MLLLDSINSICVSFLDQALGKDLDDQGTSLHSLVFCGKLFKEQAPKMH